MLLSLSNELVDSVIYFLDRKDIPSVRLVCRHLHKACQPRWEARVFDTLNFTLSETNIDELESIIQLATGREEVRRIWFLSSEAFGAHLHWPRDADGFARLDSENVARIVRILTKSFPNCTTVEVLRDYHHGAVRDETSLSAADVLSIIFHAMGLGMPPIDHFFISLETVPAEMDLCRILPSSYSSPSFWEAWAKIKTLQLAIRLRANGDDAQIAADLVCRAKSLTRLQMRDTHGTVNRICVFQCIKQAASFPSLTHLKLDGISYLSPASLIALLDRVTNTLTHLSLQYLKLNGSAKEVFEYLKGSFGHLSAVSVHSMEQAIANQPIETTVIFFCPIRRKITISMNGDDGFRVNDGWDRLSRRRFCVMGVWYRGPEMGHALSLLSECMYLASEPPANITEYSPDPPREFHEGYGDLELSTWKWNTA
ncbi:hypothetical protein VHEMI10223 [[Torrubiella] hemipterigena]|uniref:F-box domain-containing protein n=1 Tax=[Torrubiella] hemipterigena TaxID=1531966 RepID=A0A0A1TCG0_9HYPO|nr:hypothetical protein VHEMI10223 [[Torrubiella] hemipterigena]